MLLRIDSRFRRRFFYILILEDSNESWTSRRKNKFPTTEPIPQEAEAALWCGSQNDVAAKESDALYRKQAPVERY